MLRMTSAAALLERLDSLSPGSWVATDADGTIWATDVAELAWQAMMAERGIRPPGQEALAAILTEVGQESRGEPHLDAEHLYGLYLQGAIGDGPILRAMALCFAGWAEEEARAFMAKVAREHVAPRIYETSAALYRGILAQGHRLLVVSGSPDFVVEESLRLLELPEEVPVLGVTLAREGGVLQPEIVPPITWNAGKVEAIAPHLDGEPLAVAFGDSGGDLELLLAADLRILVNPRPTLTRAADADPGGPWITLAPERVASGEATHAPTSDLVLGDE